MESEEEEDVENVLEDTMKSKDFEIKFGEEGGLIKRPSNGLL